MTSHPEQASKTTCEVELSQLDLRYEGHRLKAPLAEGRLLASIAGSGIQDPLQGIELPSTRILLNGFKRLRCARKLAIQSVPFVALSQDEPSGILALLKLSNSNGSLRGQISILYYCKWLAD